MTRIQYFCFRYFFTPTWDKLMDIMTWRRAAEQMFFSLSVSWGGLIMYGSYNKFTTRVHIHATLIGILDFVTSIIAGVVVFTVLGNLSCKVEYIKTTNSIFIWVSISEASGMLIQQLYILGADLVISYIVPHSLALKLRMWFKKSRGLHLSYIRKL